MNIWMNAPKVSIIILNWNGLEDTSECLESLKQVTYPNYEAIVVDNGSEGNDAQVLKDRFGDYIHLIQNDRNYGCGEGFNTGIRYALVNSRPEYVLIMNNDIVVAPSFLDELVRAAEGDEQVGIVGPKIYYYDYKGRKDVIWFAGGKTRRWAVKMQHPIGRNDDDLPKYQAVTCVDWMTGATLMLKSCVAEKVGLFNPWYFFGGVDIEYCLRAKRHGFKLVYVPTAKVWHKVAASAKKAHITDVDPSSYYHVIKESFPAYVYIYHLLLLPIAVFRWALLYLISHRDRHTLRWALSNLAKFVLQRRK